VVRPDGDLGILGLLLPTAPQGESPGTTGTTSGNTTSPRTVPGADAFGAEGLARVCREAEAAGARSLWAVDHLFWPRPLVECLTAATVAAVSTRCVVGTCVLQLPLRPAAVVAKQAGTLQVLSGGRFVLGVGVGTHRAEYEAAGVAFEDRGRALDEGLATLRRLWADGDDPYAMAPAPGPVPVWIGGSSPAALRRAAVAGDGWVPLFLTPERYAEAQGHLDQAAAAAGRDPAEIVRSVVVFVRVGPPREAREAGTAWLSSLYGLPPSAFARHLVAGPAEACAEAVDRFRAAGAEHVVVMAAADQAVDHFAPLAQALALPAPLAGSAR
jgi:alkanesulfonate monooxygenase SsuD/methylene tetrahydromethanopterin reductase-like flavin-dependent oxidoreductase (luciferase family)